MQYDKKLMTFLWAILLSFSFLACGGAAVKTGTSAVPAKPTYDEIAVPDTISLEKRDEWRKNLLLLPVEHPKRIRLREALIETYVGEIEATDSDNVDRLVELFSQALALHAPQDFRPGGVSPKLEVGAERMISVFQERGNEPVVLASLRYLMLARPEDVRVKERYLELADWSHSVRETIVGRIEQLTSLIDLYGEIVRLVPDREIVEQLAERYVERHNLIVEKLEALSMSSRDISPLEMIMQRNALQTFPLEMMYIFFLTGDPAGARKHLAPFVEKGVVDVEVIELLDRIFQRRDLADSYFTLGNKMASIDLLASLRAYILAREADPNDYRFPLHIGRVFQHMNQPAAAVDFCWEAAKISSSPDVLTSVLELLRLSLIDVHLSENREATLRVIEMSDKLIARALESQPDQDSELALVVAQVLYNIGSVEFDDGYISRAIGHLEKSNEVVPNVPALVKLSEIHYLRAEYQKSIAVLERALAIEQRGHSPNDFWTAMILERKADAMDAAGQSQRAKVTYEEALDEWATAEIEAEQAPTMAIRRGVILDRLGDLEASTKAFRLAIRLDPNRDATYADLISYLVIRGRLEDAETFYRLAYNQDRIDAMWKIYYSLWVEGLSRRLGKGSFELARGYLEHSDGDTWQDKLAAYFAGEIDEQTLRKSIESVGQKVEADYYSALSALAEGDTDKGRSLLQQVVDSNLMGFFEYRMARSLLESGMK